MEGGQHQGVVQGGRPPLCPACGCEDLHVCSNSWNCMPEEDSHFYCTIINQRKRENWEAGQEGGEMTQGSQAR